MCQIAHAFLNVILFIDYHKTGGANSFYTERLFVSLYNFFCYHKRE
ncbi:hypothetical protein FM106_22780 [Brachybacterium faecium]|nr:hypothetical protein FM106_22780 [Brachybacterium faecium]